MTIRKAKPAKVIQEAEELDDDGNDYETRLHMYPDELAEIKATAIEEMKKFGEAEDVLHYSKSLEIERKELIEVIVEYQTLFR